MHPAPGRPRWLATLLIGGAAVACAGCNPAAGLYGQWRMDATKLQSDLAQSNPLAGAAATMMSAMPLVEPVVEFKADGTCQAAISALGNTTSLAGRWRLVRSDGGKLVIAIQMDDESTERELSVQVIDEDHLEMPLPTNVAALGNKSVPFVRVKPK